MSAGGLLQSGGVVANIWRKGIKIVASSQLPVARVLILGLGCGTAAKLVSNKWPKAKIIGVEIDPVVIKLGKKYFNLDQIPNLKIICGEAIEYVASCQLPVANKRSKHSGRWPLAAGRWQLFNLILVDLYLGEKIPQKAESLTFLKNLKRAIGKDGIVIFNRLFWGKHKKRAEEFVKKVEKVFTEVKLARTVANLLVICR